MKKENKMNSARSRYNTLVIKASEGFIRRMNGIFPQLVSIQEHRPFRMIAFVFMIL